jgi:hypothetical protein
MRWAQGLDQVQPWRAMGRFVVALEHVADRVLNAVLCVTHRVPDPRGDGVGEERGRYPHRGRDECEPCPARLPLRGGPVRAEGRDGHRRVST